jgi:cytochrome c2
MTPARNSSILYEAMWHAAILIILVWLMPATLFGTPVWSAAGVNKQILDGFAFAYVAAVVAHLVLTRQFAFPGRLTALLVTAAALSVVYLWVLLHSDAVYSRALVVAGTAVVAAGLLAPAFAPARRVPLALISLGVLAAGLLFIGVRRAGGAGSSLTERLTGHTVKASRSKHEEILNASGYTLSVTYNTGLFPSYNKPALGGAITPDPNGHGYLLVRSRGEFYRFAWDSAGELHVQPIGLHAPINNAEFEADVPKTGIETEGFRVAGLLAQPVGNATRIFITHHFWKRTEKCFVVRLSTIDIPREGTAPDSLSGKWRTVYETQPCLPLKRARGTPFAGVQMGGRLVAMGENRLLMSVGDHQFDGWYGSPDYVEDMSTPYGKTMLIDVAKGTASIFTYGNRNEQGLTVDPSGRIWETEHGPQGGDELNLLKQGQNYGWPNHTYGTEYGSVIWPLGQQSRGSSNYVRPVYAWVPSIGISDLVAVQDSAFERWRNDLLIASLRGRQLWRVRVEEGRVVYAEPIFIGERIRDITSGKGEFALWTDQETIIRITPAKAISKGAEAYSLNCGSCHHLQENRIGPTLGGVVDRPVASSPGYDYSPAMRSFGGKWTEERLNGFLARPDSAVPGTAMRYGGVADSSVRRAIIAFLRSTR